MFEVPRGFANHQTEVMVILNEALRNKKSDALQGSRRNKDSNSATATQTSSAVPHHSHLDVRGEGGLYVR